MRRSRLHVFATLLVAGLIPATQGYTQPGAERSTGRVKKQSVRDDHGAGAGKATATPRVQITARADEEITGVLSRATLRVAFSSRMDSPSHAVLRLELGDVVLDAEIDCENGTRTQTASGHELSADESAALEALTAHLRGHLRPFDHDLSPHEDLLFKAVSSWAGAPEGGPLLDITRHAGNEIAGGFRSDARSIAHAGSLDLSFASRMETPSRVVLQLQLGEAILDAEVDLEQKTATLNGHGHALTAEQLTALKQFGAQYERYVDQDDRDPLPHEDMFFRVISYWSWTPLGSALDRRVVSAPVGTCVYPIAETSGGGGICGGPKDEEELFACNEPGTCFDDNDNGVCLLEAGCDCAFYELSHDMDGEISHCFCTEIQGAGCNLDSGCQGRCGEDCDGILDCIFGGSDGAGLYTVDCAEHDRCVRAHPGGVLNPYCADELFDLADDCLFGQLATSWNCLVGCASPSCGNGVCDPGETCSNCPSDCLEGCGDGCCSGSENACNCSLDCLVPTCGDGCCNGSETCTTCPSDCGGDCPCGDGVCNGNETTCSCPVDCGSRCGDGCCNGSETRENCSQDCGNCACGDGECNCAESACSCSEDCDAVCGDGCCSPSERCANCPSDCDCDGPCGPVIQCGASYEGSTWSGQNDVDRYECNGSSVARFMNGREKFHTFTLSTTTTITIDALLDDYQQSGGDLWLFVTNSCTVFSVETCYAYLEDPGNGSITIADLPAGTYYIVVDSKTDGEGDPGSTYNYWFRLTCRWCGDGICNESCGECPVDCTPCCGDALCGGGESPSSCPRDCYCGNGACDASESACTCSADCSAACGDGCCTGNETCRTCPDDCSTCGDGCCTAGETDCNCPVDCEPICGDRCCTGNESTCNCLLDCGSACGDGCCNDTENCGNCTQDCGGLCGDGCCDGDETCATCATDCTPCPPRVQVWQERSFAYEGCTVALFAAGEDPDNDRLTYAWKQVGGKAVDWQTTTNLPTVSFVVPTYAGSGNGQDEATLLFEVSVTDGNTSPVVRTVLVPTYLAGDATHDHTVSGADFTVWKANNGSNTPENVADFDCSRSVEGADFTIWKANNGRSLP